MAKQTELRLSGSGGQGIILAGVVLAQAAILDDKIAIQSQSYGPEARGGASKSEVIISTTDIHYPKVQTPDLVMALTQIASDKYIETVKEDGIVIVDSAITLPEGLKAKKIVRVPILETARNKVGRAITANIVAIGVITEVTGLVSKEKVEETILSRVPKGTEEMNKKALYAGFEIAKEAL